MKPAVIRDPIHDIIHFQGEDGELLLKLINTKEFQRLRRIKQLAMAEMVFPAANHTRFAHSIGVMNNARLFVTALQNEGAKFSPIQKVAVHTAALLHDVGHGPFSHAFESVTGDEHETRTLEVIQNPDTEVHKVLVGYSKELPELLANFFDKELTDKEKAEQGIPAYATQIVDGQFDADRSDFLLRDSHATGTGYGRFDLPWILKELKFDGVKAYIGKKAFGSIEQFVFARYHMYLYCYFHKTIRSTEVMLKLLFEKFRELLKKEGVEAIRNRLLGASPTLVDAFAQGEKIGLDDYLRLDDGTITEFFKACAKDSDPTLSYIARGLIDRKLLKAVDLTGHDTSSVMSFGPAVAAEINNRSKYLLPDFDQASMWVSDSLGDTPYRPYTPYTSDKPIDQIDPKDQILVEVEGQGVKELSEASLPIKSLSKYKLTRYFYPDELGAIIQPVINKVLKGEA